MADLHPEVEKMIEAGQLSKNIVLPDGSRTGWQESVQEFARRVALHAVEKEREEVNSLIDRNDSGAAHTLNSIRRRGKP